MKSPISQGAFVGLLGGFTASLWVGIGAQLYPPLPHNSMPLNLSTAHCNTTGPGAEGNWTTLMAPQATERWVHGKFIPQFSKLRWSVCRLRKILFKKYS